MWKGCVIHAVPADMRHYHDFMGRATPTPGVSPDTARALRRGNVLLRFCACSRSFVAHKERFLQLPGIDRLAPQASPSSEAKADRGAPIQPPSRGARGVGLHA